MCKVTLFYAFTILLFFNYGYGQVAISTPVIQNDHYSRIPSSYLDKEAASTFFEHLERAVTKGSSGNVSFPRGKSIQVINSIDLKNLKDLGSYRQQLLQSRNASESVANTFIQVSSVSNKRKLTLIFRLTLKLINGDKTIINESAQIKIRVTQPVTKRPNLASLEHPLVPAFPISRQEFNSILVQLVNQLEGENRKSTLELFSDTTAVHDYDSLFLGSWRYKLTTRNNDFRQLSKVKLFGLINLQKERQMPFVRIADQQTGNLLMSESLITDINLSIGSRSNAGISRYQRNFKTKFVVSNRAIVSSNVRAVAWNPTVLKSENFGSIELSILGDHHGKLKFSNPLLERNDNTIHLGRLLYPNGALVGEIDNVKVEVLSSSFALNALEFRVNGTLVAVAVHANASYKYLRRGKKKMAWTLHVDSKTSRELEGLILQLFQYNRIAYLIYREQLQNINRAN